jgi:hypothetical protein
MTAAGAEVDVTTAEDAVVTVVVPAAYETLAMELPIGYEVAEG